MSELVDFLTARLDEDEEWAGIGAAYVAEYDAAIARQPGASFALTPMHGVGHPFDPARVLREVTAKRRIMDGLRDAEAVIARIGPDLTGPGDAAEWANYHAWHAAAEALAAPFCDHPDFQEQWR